MPVTIPTPFAMDGFGAMRTRRISQTLPCDFEVWKGRRLVSTSCPVRHPVGHVSPDGLVGSPKVELRKRKPCYDPDESRCS